MKEKLRKIIREEIGLDPGGEQWIIELELDAPPGRSHLPFDLLGDKFGEWNTGGVFFGEQRGTSKRSWSSKAEAQAFLDEGLVAYVKNLYNRGAVRYAGWSVVRKP